MKLLKYFLIILIFCSGQNVVYAQNIALPKKIDLFQYIVPKGVIYDYAHPYNDIYGFPDVRVWGWSTKGKIAYSSERNIEGRGGVSIQFIIFDLVEDRIDFEIDIDSNDYKIDEFKENTIMYLYNLNSKDINNAISKNNIVHKENIYSSLPGKIKNVNYSCHANIEYEDAPEFYDKIKEYSIIVNRNNKSKTVKTSADVEAISVYICGYFKSPFEDRILIVTAEERAGFEGTELYYYFVGCHLERGFN
ncbi:hypothetical protein FACS189494_03440 [Spirochaetia bacterium]|nr:hypothetical protein FACS189494_03440 [Spirochaetia bacterium]